MTNINRLNALTNHKLAADRITKARTWLLMNQPFFGTLTLRLTPQVARIPTFSTNGSVIKYNPAYVNQITDLHLRAVLAHEVMHCALGHPHRRGNRDPEDWNIANDYIINDILIAAGFTLPDGALVDSRFNGSMYSEEVYNIIHQERQQQQGQQGQQGAGAGQGQEGQQAPSGGKQDDKAQEQGKGGGKKDDEGAPGGAGDDKTEDQGGGSGSGENDPQADAGDEWPDYANNPMGMVEDADTGESGGGNSGTSGQDWQTILAGALVQHKGIGNISGDLVRIIEEILRPGIDWKTLLARFCLEADKSDHSWTPPNKRLMAQGIYMPSLRGHTIGEAVVFIDSSGSISRRQMDVAVAEVVGLMEQMEPTTLYVIFVDKRVKMVQEFERGDDVVLEPKGGGGTAFAPAFKYIQEHGIEPKFAIYLTDLASNDWKAIPVPDYEVLWLHAVPRGYGKGSYRSPYVDRVTFGEVVDYAIDD